MDRVECVICHQQLEIDDLNLLLEISWEEVDEGVWECPHCIYVSRR